MKNNIKTIAIIDDNPENLKAATTAVAEIFLGIKVSTFNSATEFLAEVGEEKPPFDLVITDMKMEEPRSGKKVAYQSWLWGIPTVIVSGGKDHGTDKVWIGYQPKAFIGSKEEVNTWKKILEFIFSEHFSNAVLIMIRRGKLSKPDTDLAEVGALASGMSLM
ncbi:MAG: hypothetical protein WCO09_01770 [bacterium]